MIPTTFPKVRAQLNEAKAIRTIAVNAKTQNQTKEFITNYKKSRKPIRLLNGPFSFQQQ